MAHFLVLGATGVGKSSTINALTQKTMAKVGYGSEPKTQKLMGYGANGYVLWDTPGLGEGVNEDIRHIQHIKSLLSDSSAYHISHILLIVEANKRDLGTVYKVIEEIVLPKYSKSLTIVLNQADQAMKGRNWDHSQHSPTMPLVEFLNNQTETIQVRVKENTGVAIKCPLYYSAATGFGVSELHQYLKQLSLEYKNARFR